MAVNTEPIVQDGACQNAAQAETEEVNSLEEAFAVLTYEELQLMAVRLTKCHEGFHEMLQEAEDEKEHLRRETTELNNNIGLAMQGIHRQEREKTKPKKAVVAVKVGMAWNNLNQQVWGNLHQQVAQKTKGILSKGTELISAKALRNSDDKENQKQATREARQAARRQAREARKQAEAEQEQRDQEAEAAEPNVPAAIKSPEKKPRTPVKPLAAPPVIVARDPASVVKRKPIVVMASTVVLEAKLTIADGSCHMLHVHMTDSCEEAAKKFILEHSQRQWFEKPLAAWLKRAEADATKLPSRIEASLAELRKQHSKA